MKRAIDLLLRRRQPVVPCPAAFGGHLRLDVDHLVELALPADSGESRFVFQHRWHKLAFFALREGLQLTLNKIRASRLHHQINQRLRVVVAIGRREGDGALMVAAGPQPSPDLERMSFPEVMCVDAPDEAGARIILARLRTWLEWHPQSLRELHFYSPFSGRKLSFTAGAALDEWQALPDQPEYSETRSLSKPVRQVASGAVRAAKPGSDEGRPQLFLIGAGAYPCAYILPLLPFQRCTVVDINPVTAAEIGSRFGFANWASQVDDVSDLIAASANPVLVVATYHSTHLEVAETALKANPRAKIFIEKPPVTTHEQLERLLQLRQESRHFIEIGYNRRHVPYLSALRETLHALGEPVTMTCIVKELNIPFTHWYYWPTQGTRITGNVSHWLDLGIFLIGSNPIEVATVAASAHFVADEVAISIRFGNGSLLNIVASDRGNGLRGVQEYIEIRCGDLTVKVDDFMRFERLLGGRNNVKRCWYRDKGHQRMYLDFVERVSRGVQPFYPSTDLATSTRLYLSVVDSLLGKASERAVGQREPSARAHALLPRMIAGGLR